MCCSRIVLAVIFMVPDRVCLVWEILFFACCVSWSIFSAAFFRVVPASVISMPLAVRLKSSASKYCSRAAMWLLMVPWLVPSCFAADEKLRVFATVRNVLR